MDRGFWPNMGSLYERRSDDMASEALISIFCADRPGLVAAVAGRLFDLGVNLGDTSFAVLGEGAEFTALCELPAGLDPSEVERELKELPELDEARVTVSKSKLGPYHKPSANVTHRIELSGHDRPGMIARLAEAFVQYDANIVRMTSEKVPGAEGDRYVTRFAVKIPAGRADACLATIGNTAGELKMTCRWEKV